MIDIFTKKLGVKKGAVLFCIVFAVLFIALNVIVALLPSSITKYDLTRYGMYTLTDQSVQQVKAVDEKVDIYIMMYPDQSNETMMTVLERYKSVNKNISVEILDMTTDNEFISKYSAYPEPGSLIIESAKRSVYIPYFYLFYFSDQALTDAITYYTYSYQAGYYEGSINDFMREYSIYLGLYDGYVYEDAVTSAIQYVTADDIVTLYATKGHKEMSLTDEMLYRFMNEGIEVKSLDLASSEIPQDCDGILMLPNADITSAEQQKLSAYTEAGGKIILGTLYGVEYTELYKLTSQFGLESTKDYLCDDSAQGSFEMYPTMIVPTTDVERYASFLDGEKTFTIFGGSTGITVAENKPQGIVIEEILKTSENAYRNPDVETEGAGFNSETDTRGQYLCAALSKNENGGALYWITSSAVVFDDYDYYNNFGNKQFFVQAVKDTCGSRTSITVPAAIVTDEILEAQPWIVYTLLVVFVAVPLAIVVAGFILYRKRKLK